MGMSRCGRYFHLQVSGSSAATILVVDDDAKIVQLVRTYLEREGYRVISAVDGRSALEAAREQRPSLIVLDVMLPEVDGLAVTRLLRRNSDVAVLMLSARGTAADRIAGLSEGADDYLAKPFSPAELVMRVKAILRRADARGQVGRDPLRLADLVIDIDRHEVLRDRETILLSLAEFRILAALVSAGGRVLDREALLNALYGDGAVDAVDRTVDVYVRRLREKLGDDPERPRYVTTVRGVGYRAVLAAR
ncbi:MAG TPA: response regulator transcription factor [Candidatus Limnocylindria bacterium]|nr:response regulator transcription factor [Candidatus Limnocylindria bacterium]